MSKSLLVSVTVVAVLACPYLCREAGLFHAHREACGALDRQTGSTPADHDAPADEGDDHDCSCFCCNGALPRSEVVAVAAIDPREFTGVVEVSSGGCQVSVVGHHRWRLQAPDSDTASGRALRARIASLLI
ncbi:MAG: hypothetical protein ACT4QC_04270 [Planctomycetaceae bacterium]